MASVVARSLLAAAFCLVAAAADAEQAPAAWCGPLPATAKVKAAAPGGIFSHGSFYVAAGLGYFKDENIDLELVGLNRSADGFPLLARGMIDVLSSGYSSAFFNMISDGMTFRGTLSLGTYNPAAPAGGVYVRKELVQSGTVKTVADMRGRRIALDAPAGTTVRYVFSHWLATGGLQFKDVDIVDMPLTSISAALKAGTIDGAYVSSAYSALLRDDGQVALGDQSSLAGNGFDTNITLFMNGDFLQQRRDVARRVIRAVLRANRDMTGDYRAKPQIVFALATGLKLSEKMVLDNAPMNYRADGALNPDTLKSMQQLFIVDKSIKFAEPLSFDKLADDQLRREAVQSLDGCRG
jgi:NitT/TauT family transport system substrate-binding protein